MTPNDLHEQRWQILQVLHRYCENVDRKDWEGMRAVFTEDTVGDYNGMVVEGLQTLIDSGISNMANEMIVRTQHNVSNPRITIDGDKARCVTNYYAVHLGGGRFEGQIYSMWGEYDDQLVRTDQGWRIARRDYQTFFTEGDERMVWAGEEPGWNKD